MKPDEQTLKQFKILYKKEFGEELSNEEALERFLRLINVVRIVYFPELSSPLDKPYGYDIVRT